MNERGVSSSYFAIPEWLVLLILAGLLALGLFTIVKVWAMFQG